MKLAITWEGVIVIAILIGICLFNLYRGTKNDAYIDSSSYPVDAANYILEEVDKGNLDLETMKMYNDYNYGSYLLFRGIPVFIDSRADLYSPEFNEGVSIFKDFLNISGISTYYEGKFKKYEITHVMTGAKSKLQMLLKRDKNYKELYRDDHFVLFERLSQSKNEVVNG